MIENPVFEKVLVYSGDATVNAVLTAKGAHDAPAWDFVLRQSGYSHELPFEKPDLCALFANALDNAAEGCAALETGKRQVELTARAAKGLLALEVRNPFTEKQETSAVQFLDSLPKTTKIRYSEAWFWTAQHTGNRKKYGGTMELRQEDGWFCLFCFIPE